MSQASMRSWVPANALGLCLAFLSFVPGQAVTFQFAPQAMIEFEAQGALPDHIDPDALPAGLDREDYEQIYRFNLIGHVIGLTLFGAILGSFQAFALGTRLPRRWPWILAATAGVPSILVFEAIRRHLVIGPFRGPVEPIMIALGGGALAATYQWLYLRRQGSGSAKWLGLWTAGLAAGIAVSVAVIITIELTLLPTLLGLFESEAIAGLVDWSIFLIIYGVIVGAAAAWASRRALLDALAALPNRPAPPADPSVAGSGAHG